MIFVDTSAWYASVVPDDPNHVAAGAFLARNSQPLITTDWIVDETLTLLRMRREHTRAATLGAQFFEGTVATLLFASREQVLQARAVFRDYSDKEWSFTDCLSKVVIAEHAIPLAFAFDHHFRQFASVIVVPRRPS